MRILIAIESCQMRNEMGCNQAIRDTWLKDFAAYPDVDCRFFMGSGATPDADTVIVDACDGYEGLTRKTREIHRWSVIQRYEFTFVAMDDTFVSVSRLMQSKFENHDYCGRIHTWPGSPSAPQGYCCTGDGVWLSHRASEAIAVAEPDDWAEDRWVGKIVGLAGMKVIDVAGYGTGITWHGSVIAGRLNSFDAQWMYKKYGGR